MLGDSGKFVEAFVQGGVWTVNLSHECDVDLKFPVRLKPYWWFPWWFKFRGLLAQGNIR